MAPSNTERSRKFQTSWSTEKEIDFINGVLDKKRTTEKKIKFIKSYIKSMDKRENWAEINQSKIKGLLYVELGDLEKLKSF